ncbi:hypothetical protein [Noviherbaspirillum humi]|uniref:hypothetical protein n=1 Tax=Noviherbaspirillum humi TaxID=1688639 RepID=UPI001160B2D1|nr:hypothetical protein [Noviherbaspirillum humi]
MAADDTASRSGKREGKNGEIKGCKTLEQTQQGQHHHSGDDFPARAWFRAVGGREHGHRLPLQGQSIQTGVPGKVASLAILHQQGMISPISQ